MVIIELTVRLFSVLTAFCADHIVLHLKQLFKNYLLEGLHLGAKKKKKKN